MKLESKFDIGDNFYCIQKFSKPVYKVCPACEGGGYIHGKNGDRFSCPNCTWNRGQIKEYGPDVWNIRNNIPLTVGRVCVYRYSNNVQKEEYMADETGIDTGSIYHVEEMFHTKEEAQTECDRRNNG